MAYLVNTVLVVIITHGVREIPMYRLHRSLYPLCCWPFEMVQKFGFSSKAHKVSYTIVISFLRRSLVGVNFFNRGGPCKIFFICLRFICSFFGWLEFRNLTASLVNEETTIRSRSMDY